MNHLKKPAWLRRRLPTGPQYEEMRAMLSKTSLHTVCQEAHCPNQWECFSEKTATFLLLGERCTRSCRFCAVQTGKPKPADPEEPRQVKEIVDLLGLCYVVLTSVTRDDLADGGAHIFAECIESLHRLRPKVDVEVLIPDFKGNINALKQVIAASPVVIGHNMETVPRLYSTVRPQAIYQRSLNVIRQTREHSSSIMTKSGLMLGLGETENEVEQVLIDLREAGCQLLTLGQYLQPSQKHLPVVSYITPDDFQKWQQRAKELGFKAVTSGPFVRSSYKAAQMAGL